MKPLGVNGQMRAFFEREKLRELRCKRINEELRRTEDRGKLRYLNLLFWKVYFGLLDEPTVESRDAA